MQIFSVIILSTFFLAQSLPNDKIAPPPAKAEMTAEEAIPVLANLVFFITTCAKSLPFNEKEVHNLIGVLDDKTKDVPDLEKRFTKQMDEILERETIFATEHKLDRRAYCGLQQMAYTAAGFGQLFGEK